MSITVYGASDDLIEIEGDISEEFNALGEESGSVLAFSDGTLLSVLYDDNGIWRFNRLRGGSAAYSKDENPPTDEDRYSDRVTLDGDVQWVTFGAQKAIS